jgi:flagellar basal body-associated protein FliL
MAEEEKEQDAGAEEEGGGKKSKKMLMIIVGAGVLLIVGSIGVGLALGHKARPEPDSPIKQNETPVMVSFQDLYVNIAETKATRVLKLTVTLTLSEEGLLAVIEAHRPIILDMISEVASYMTIEELEGRSGRGILKREIKNRVNDLLQGQGKGAVDNVYFTDFLIQ